MGNRENSSSAGTIVIRARVNRSFRAGLEMIIMSAESNIFILQPGVCTIEHPDHVLGRHPGLLKVHHQNWGDCGPVCDREHHSDRSRW